MLKFWRKWADRGTEAEAGFTLIEMSIVLVIIGLLIGGVLKGQELINSTRLKSVVSQWDSTKAAYNAFQDRYLGLPGDYPTAAADISATGVLGGGGNGVIGLNVIGAAAFAGAANVGAASENLNFWAHLTAARLISGVTLGAGAGVATPAATGGILSARIAGTFWTMENATPVAGGITADYLVLQTGTAAIAASLSGAQYAELERKFDNNNSLNGSLVEATAAAGGCTTAAGAMAPLALGVVCIPLFSLSQ